MRHKAILSRLPTNYNIFRGRKNVKQYIASFPSCYILEFMFDGQAYLIDAANSDGYGRMINHAKKANVKPFVTTELSKAFFLFERN